MLRMLRPAPRRLAFVLLATVAAVLLGACGEKKKERPKPQVAARVDGHAITDAQLRLVLEQQGPLRPEQADAAGRQVLARLIDQRLLVAQAERLELERDPRVRERLDAARRDILARAYAERLDEGAPPPSPAEIDAYYRAHPERFAQRRIYTLQELMVDARPDQFDALRALLQTPGSIADLARELEARGLRFTLGQAVRAAEQLPPQTLQNLSRLGDGQALLLPTPGGAVVMVLAASRSAPLAPEEARPLIEPLLLAERRRRRLEQELQSLRAAARIETRDRGAAAGAASAPPASTAASTTASTPAPASAPLTTAHKDPP
ncbi:MAG: hypothetical protein AMXMBFR78_17900 [Rubrivivax sp.]|jgi:EpsD family peptidyl-prolyl cis-trans isomerase|nr:EpsD family peptidyl-prolyl cis-trans isomerase [Rubrivivax sp.]